MHKSVRAILLLFLFLFMTVGMTAQSETSAPYPQVDSTSLPKPAFPVPNKWLKEYMLCREAAKSAYYNKQYIDCVDFYEKTPIYMIDGYLKFIAGVSYYYLSKDGNDTGQKNKAKLLLIQARHEGYSEADDFLKHNLE